MNPLTDQEKLDLKERFENSVNADIEAGDQEAKEILEEFNSIPDPWYGVPLWLLRWLMKHLPKK